MLSLLLKRLLKKIFEHFLLLLRDKAYETLKKDLIIFQPFYLFYSFHCSGKLNGGTFWDRPCQSIMVDRWVTQDARLGRGSLACQVTKASQASGGTVNSCVSKAWRMDWFARKATLSDRNVEDGSRFYLEESLATVDEGQAACPPQDPIIGGGFRYRRLLVPLCPKSMLPIFRWYRRESGSRKFPWVSWRE